MLARKIIDREGEEYIRQRGQESHEKRTRRNRKEQRSECGFQSETIVDASLAKHVKRVDLRKSELPGIMTVRVALGSKKPRLASRSIRHLVKLSSVGISRRRTPRCPHGIGIVRSNICAATKLRYGTENAWSTDRNIKDERTHASQNTLTSSRATWKT